MTSLSRYLKDCTSCSHLFLMFLCMLVVRIPCALLLHSCDCLLHFCDCSVFAFMWLHRSDHTGMHPCTYFLLSLAAVTQELWVWLTKHMGLDVCSRIMKVSPCSEITCCRQKRVSPLMPQQTVAFHGHAAANSQYHCACPCLVRSRCTGGRECLVCRHMSCDGAWPILASCR